MEQVVYKGEIIKVTTEKIGEILWERAYLPHGVIIYPITKEGKILLINEKRPHENPPHRVKAVSGILEPEKGSPEENAQREMQEEIGFKAGKLEHLWTLTGTGTINQYQHFFIARDLIASKLPNPDGEETIMEILEYAPEEILKMLMEDQMKWSLSTLGLFRLLQRLGTLR